MFCCSALIRYQAIDLLTFKAFGALRDRVFSTRDVSERLKGKIYSGGVLGDRFLQF